MREGLGFALRQVDQDVGDVARLVRQVDAGDHVGAVLGFGEPRRLGVGGGLGQRVDRGALRLALAPRERVGMDRDEQRRLPRRAPSARARRAERRCRRCASSPRGICRIFSSWSRSSSAKSSTIVLFHARRSPPRCRYRCRHGRDRSRRSAADRRVARRSRSHGGRRARLRRRGFRAPASRMKALAVDRGEIEHQPRRLACRGIEHERLVDPHRLGRRRCTMREPPCMTRPKRNALTRPRPASPVLGGSWKVTCGRSITTR